MDTTTNEITNVFEAHAEHYENAYQAHLKKWALLNPKPQKPDMSSLITWHHYVVTLILIASAIVSASHTLPVVMESNVHIDPPIAVLLAIATFIMIEITAIYFAYAHIVSSHDEYHMPDITTPLKIGVFSTVGALFAINVYGVLGASNLIQTDLPVWNVLGVGIYLWVGCIPPINAYLCGDVLAINVIQLKSENTVAINEYYQHMDAWRDRFERSWNAKKKDYDVTLKVSKPDSHQTDNMNRLSASMSVQTDNRQTGAGYRRASTATDNARQWLLANTDKIDLPLRELATLIPNAGKDSIRKARTQIRNDNDSIGDTDG